MCVGLPVQVLSSQGSVAVCRDHRGAEQCVDLLLVGTQPEGTWLMSFLGAARAVIDADEARRLGEALDALDALMNGEAADLDAAFADLTGRKPRLPDFLQGEDA